MSDDDEDVLPIKQCPKCGKPHRFQLDVERSYVMYKMSYNMPEATKKEFTRLFTCPITKEDFQARFWLIESFGERIESVQIKGALDENKEKQD